MFAFFLERQRIFDWEALIDDEAARQEFPIDELLPSKSERIL